MAQDHVLTDEQRDAIAEAGYEQHYPSGVTDPFDSDEYEAREREADLARQRKRSVHQFKRGSRIDDEIARGMNGRERSPDQLRLLRTYLDGARIWDAAALQPDVYYLLDRRLIEPCPGCDMGGACVITGAGRKAAEEKP